MWEEGEIRQRQQLEQISYPLGAPLRRARWRLDILFIFMQIRVASEAGHLSIYLHVSLMLIMAVEVVTNFHDWCVI